MLNPLRSLFALYRGDNDADGAVEGDEDQLLTWFQIELVPDIAGNDHLVRGRYSDRSHRFTTPDG